MSSTEWFFAQLLNFYYNKFPDASGINDRALTFADLKNFNSIIDAEKHLIEQKIENILRGNIESWFEYMKRDFKLSLSYIDKNLDTIIEISQRRNLYIHNGGIVNSIYLKRVSSKLTSKLKIESRIPISKEYVDSSLAIMQLNFLLIALELWKKLDPENEQRAALLDSLIYENLLTNDGRLRRDLVIF